MSVQLHRYTHENINYLLVWKLFLVVLVMRFNVRFNDKSVFYRLRIYPHPIASAGVSLFLSLAVCFCAITSS